jgi:hypothetical protein
MPMNKFDAAIHRTLVDSLIHSKQVELAAVMIDGEVNAGYEWDNDGNATFVRYYLDISTRAYPLIETNQAAQDALAEAIRNVAGGQRQTTERLPDIPFVAFPVAFRVKMLEVEDGWEAVARSLIANPKGANQALVSDLAGDGRPLHRWNELRYASASEIRIAQELEKRNVLFFPLAVGVPRRGRTGRTTVRLTSSSARTASGASSKLPTTRIATNRTPRKTSGSRSRVFCASSTSRRNAPTTSQPKWSQSFLRYSPSTRSDPVSLPLGVPLLTQYPRPVCPPYPRGPFDDGAPATLCDGRLALRRRVVRRRPE